MFRSSTVIVEDPKIQPWSTIHLSKLSSDLSSVTVVGLDLAKHVFQLHCVDGEGRAVLARSLRRRELIPFFRRLPPCLIGMEACSSAHHWGREINAQGHEVRLMPPAYVKPYVRRQKNDAADAAAICEAVTRPAMRFVAVRSLENQAVLMRHKVREMLVAQRTQLLNGLRGHLAEAGVIAAQGAGHARALAGAHAVLHHRARHADPLRLWASKLLETKPFKLVAVALANKLARIAFAVLSRQTRYA